MTDRDSDPRSPLARAMRVCNARGLLAPTQAIEADLDLHDQRLVDDALAAGNLVAWKFVREFQKRA